MPCVTKNAQCPNDQFIHTCREPKNTFQSDGNNWGKTEEPFKQVLFTTCHVFRDVSHSKEAEAYFNLQRWYVIGWKKAAKDGQH